MAFYLYAEDNDSGLARCGQDPDRWVDRPHAIDTSTGARDYSNRHNSTIEEKENGIKGGVLFPYAETVNVFHCAGDKRYRVNVGSRGKGAYRSFAIPGAVGGWGGSKTISGYTLYPVDKYTDFQSPGDKYIFVEENYTHRAGDDPSLPSTAGYNNGVWSFWMAIMITTHGRIRSPHGITTELIWATLMGMAKNWSGKMKEQSNSPMIVGPSRTANREILIRNTCHGHTPAEDSREQYGMIYVLH